MNERTETYSKRIRGQLQNSQLFWLLGADCFNFEEISYFFPHLS